MTTLLVMFTAMLALAQAPAFEVAAVKPSKIREGGDGTISVDPGRFSARNATLKHLIFEAYRIPYSQITGGPDWIDSDEFDIEAKPATPGSPAELRVMLQMLLADRFKLALHSVQRQSNVYVLTVGKVKEAPGSSPPTADPSMITRPGGSPSIVTWPSLPIVFRQC